VFVELDVFSGRPNPSWELDDRTSEELRQLQSRLTKARQTAPEPPGLGYRGFLYGDGDRARAYRGFVRTPEGDLADPTFSIERFLLDRLPAEYSGLRSRIEAELTPK
jgi:hypothetical protein